MRKDLATLSDKMVHLFSLIGGVPSLPLLCNAIAKIQAVRSAAAAFVAKPASFRGSVAAVDTGKGTLGAHV